MDGFQKPVMMDLPVNVLLQIFKYLSHEDLISGVRRTCKVWNQLTYERVFWREISLSLFPGCGLATKSFLELIADTVDSIETLVVDLDKLESKVIDHEGIYCPNLKEVCLKGGYSCSVFEEHYEDVNQCLRNLSEKYCGLESLKLVCSDFITDQMKTNDRFNEQSGSSTIETLFPNLKSVTFARNSDRTPGFNERELKRFLASHRHLKELSIKNCALKASTLELIFTEMPDIKKLDLRNSLSSLEFEFDALDLISEKICLTNLRVLVLCECKLSDKLLRSFAKHSQHLEELLLTGVEGITNIGLESVAMCCPKLKRLLLNNNPFLHVKSNVTDAGIERIAEHCHQLKVLNLRHCTEISDVAINAVASGCSWLEELYVSDCLSLTDMCLVNLVKNCTRLSVLDVSNCSQLTSKSVNAILTQCKALRRFSVGMCHRVKDISLVHKEEDDETARISDTMNGSKMEEPLPSQAKHTPVYVRYDALNLGKHSHVYRLDFHFCSALTNACIKQLANYCRDLRELNVQACALVTNAGVKEIVKKCTFLRKLNISGGSMSQTSRLTDSCLEDIAVNAKNLENLTITQNFNITAESVFEVVRKCPQIMLVVVDHGARNKRSNIVQDRLIDLSGEVPEKTICLQFRARTAEVHVYRNCELYIRSQTVRPELLTE
ncbi:F-box/LRR-repeat protein 7-like [Mya arenaria]|uniref:F-box/LRR-repeat protein 7-like n=1 Tax=Mya arenaria TaxID=6604 RepID=UPI0022E84DB2|nr:F-box/LRR-repeat protein 7-like [Mya arenaria]